MRTRISTILSRCMVALVAVAMAATMVACSSGGGEAQPATTEAAPTEVRVASLSGPTSIGLVEMMDRAEAGEYANDYEFTVAGVADEVTTGLIQGDYDIALLPANAASVVYNKTEGEISVVDINPLGVLYVVTGDESVTSFADLAGRTVYTTGKGTTPEYALNYLLEENGIADQVTVEFKSEASELAAVLQSDPDAICVLPEPFATATMAQNEGLHRVCGLTDEWAAVQGEDGSSMVTGVTVVRNDFLEEHPEAVAEFVEAQAASVEWVNENPDEAGELVAEVGIIEKAQMAARAIPNCSLVCVTGDEMRTALEGYLQVLYDQDPASVGGEMPGDAFYATDVA